MFPSAEIRARWPWWLGAGDELLTRELFLRLLALVYLIAFVSWAVQISGLVGASGILSEPQLLRSVRGQFGARGYYILPTLGWLHPGGGFLKFLAWIGAALSLTAIAGLARGPVFLALWALYLAQVTTGGDFLEFQWDGLLLEAGFLAVFFAAWSFGRAARAPSIALLWLLRWLTFRLMFSSGVVKLLSHDPVWRNLTALHYHYWTQPIPNAVAWYAAQLPGWFQSSSVAVMFAIELGVPFLICGPRVFRHAAAALISLLQLGIALTGNYAFFNLLAVVLCVTLLDDRALTRLMPARVRLWLVGRAERTSTPALPPHAPAFGTRLKLAATLLFSLVIVWLSAAQMFRQFTNARTMDPLSDLAAPFYITSPYGLFASMTTSRLEIVVEGSRDGVNWQAYEFRYKPGDVTRRPPFVAPHQPRLDWQMWFAALGSYRTQPWFINFVVRLLQGSHDVEGLLEKDPFPDRPPVYIRALAYDYHFTTFAERRATGAWWKRELLGFYLRPISLQSVVQGLSSE